MCVVCVRACVRARVWFVMGSHARLEPRRWRVRAIRMMAYAKFVEGWWVYRFCKSCVWEKRGGGG